MKLIFSTLLIASVICSCNNNKKETTPAEEKPIIKTDSTLVTDSSWGLVTKGTDIAGLQKAYGNEFIKDERICGAECVDSVDVTFVYPGTPKEFVVYWKDSLYHKTIAFVESNADSSVYHTSTGLKNNSTMVDLLRVNGQKITFSGFGWDYGGSIQSFNNGSLEKSPVRFQLDLLEDPESKLEGDIELNTDMPHVKKLLDKIIIRGLSLSFAD